MTESSDVERTDAELIAEAVEGSEAAFGQLIRRHEDRLFGLLSRLIRDRYAVEDLAQDVFVRVFRKLHTFNQESAFFTWLYRIAVNAAADFMERRGRRGLRLVEDISTLDQGEREPGYAGAAEPLLAEELRRVTREILATLPEKYRTILVLREFEDMSYTDMAAVLECSIGTVESRLFRARQRFRTAMERMYPDLVPITRGGRR